MKQKNKINKNKRLKKSTFLTLVIFYYRKYIYRCLCLFLLTFMSASCAIVVPKLTQKIMSTEILLGPLKTFYEYSSVIISIFFLRGIFMFFSSNVAGRLGKRIEVDLRNKLLTHLTKLDISFYDDKKIGEILTKVISDTEIVGVQAQLIPQSILSTLFISIGSIVVMFTINVKLTFVTIGLCLLLLTFLPFLFFLLKKSMLKIKSVLTKINGDVTDRLSNINLVKSSGTEQYEENRFKDLHKEYYELSKHQIKMQSMLIAFLISFLSSVNILILIIGVILLRNHNLYLNNNNANDPNYLSNGMGIIIAEVMGVNALILPIMGLSRTFIMLAQASTSATRIHDLLAKKCIIDPNLSKPKLLSISGSINFKNLTFKYPTREENIFSDFSYNFEKGKSYAFVGETGVGKSTISKLLLRFYDPTSGEILINNNEKDLKKINLPSYLKYVGYVEQEPSILAGTFFENIKYGNFSASNEEAMEAAKKAEIHKYISSLKNGYNTIIGEHGSTLSGGQKQRLVIARMFLKNPDILILDEATSSLDNIVEKEIQKNLDLLMVNRTTFVIAHRLSTIKNVDQILVLEKDKGIVQIGTFNELINKPGHFQKLYKAGLMLK